MNLAAVALFIGLMLNLASIHDTKVESWIDRLLDQLHRSKAIFFIGRQESQGVRATRDENPEGDVSFEPDPGGEIVMSREGWGIGVYAPSYGLNPRPEVWTQSQGDQEEYMLVTTRRIEAPLRVYGPIGVAALAIVGIALAVQPGWLLIPFGPWIQMARELQQVAFEFPSIIVDPLSAIGFLLLGLVSFTAYVSFIVVPSFRLLAGLGGWAHERWSTKAYRGTLTVLALASYALGIATL